MFEKEIKFIGDFCFNQVRSLGNSFTLDKIVSVGVHPALVQYISAELDFMIYSDRRKLLQQSYFDYAGKEISEHFQKISSEIKKHKKISLDDSKKLIFQAVSFNINYLVRPRWSLMKLIFNDQPVISIEEMKMLLNYLYYYEYFRNVLNGYISKRKLVQISSTEFDILLNKIDNELINSNQHQVISNSFTSIGDFFNVGGVDKNRLPLSAVEIFCKEKNLVELILRLRKVFPGEVKRRYDKIEIEKILFSTDTIQLTEKETDIDTETGTEQMIKALETEESNNEVDEVILNSSDDSAQAEINTFLSPEEEEALLSLYSEETKEPADTDKPVLKSSTLEIANEEFKESRVEGVKTALPDLLDSFSAESVQPEKNTNNSDSIKSTETDDIEIDSIDISEEEIVESSVVIEDEFEEIMNESSENLADEEIEIDEMLLIDSVDSSDSKIDVNAEDEKTGIIESGIEKEIVQEMIEDFYTDSKEEASSSVDYIEPEKIVEPATNSSEEEPENKINSLEDDLLNIFEGLDKEEFKFPEKERFSIDIPDSLNSELQIEEKEEALVSTETTDGFDEYLKSIDELIFTDKSSPKVEHKKQVEVELKVEAPVKKNVEVKEQPLSKPSNKNSERVSNKTRTLRQKDLFSYLKRKEVKKIVSYIFANDEEDFTNTVERIMDCNTYKEASEILKAVFTSYKISPYSKEAITFTNSVSNYFRQA